MELERNKEKHNMESSVRTELDKFKQLVLLTKNIDFDPEGTLQKMTTVCPETPNLANLQEGLKGQFTRDQSVALAKTQLFNSLGSTVEAISKNLEGLKLDNYINNIMQEVSSYVDTVIESVDAKELLKRKEAYSRNSVTMEYFKKKLDQIVNEKAVLYKSNKPTDLLFCMREVLSMVLINDLSYVDPLIAKIKEQASQLRFYFDAIGTPEYKALEIQSTQQESIVKPEEILTTYLTKAKVDTTNETNPIDIISGMIERTEQTLTGLAKTRQEIIDKLHSLPKLDGEIIETLTKLLSETILGYLKFNKITVNEFNARLKDGYEVIEGLLMLTKDERVIVYNIVLSYLNNVIVFKEIYNILNEITTNGTFVEK